MHPDMAEELPFLTLPVGTGGVPVYLPPTGATGAPYATLYGKPIIETDHMAEVGKAGDIGPVSYTHLWGEYVYLKYLLPDPKPKRCRPSRRKKNE